MKSIQQAMLEEILESAMEVSRKHGQTEGMKNNYYITIQQLEEILNRFNG